ADQLAAGSKTALLLHLHDIIGHRRFVAVADLRRNVLRHRRTSHVELRVSAIVQTSNRCSECVLLCSELLQESDLPAGRSDGDLLVFAYAAIDELDQGFFCAHETVWSEMQIVDEEQNRPPLRI